MPNGQGEYYWDVQLPAGKTGRHVVYSVWQRSDSAETFYGCSDVVFDGGNGEVIGIPDGPEPQPTPTPDAHDDADGAPRPLHGDRGRADRGRAATRPP